MSLATERRIAIRNTREIIDGDPIDVIVVRRPKVATAAGGSTKGTPLSLPPQRIRLVPLSGNVWDRSRQQADTGNMLGVVKHLLAMPDANFQKDDTFWYNDQHWEVVHISPEKHVRIWGNLKLLES